MRYIPRRRGPGRLVWPALALACLTAFAAPAEAGVHAFRTSDGSEDAAFVSLGARTTATSIVPDGAQGVYLIGRIFVDGGQRQIVHLRANGTVDPGFRVTVRGGAILSGALMGRDLAIAGTFAAIGGLARSQVAIVDGRSGEPLAWAPQLPAHPRVNALSHLVVARSTLVLSTSAGLSAWRPGVARPIWTIKNAPAGFDSAVLASWRGSVWSLGAGNIGGLARIDPVTGRAHVASLNYDHVTELEAVGPKLVALAQGNYFLYDGVKTTQVRPCGQSHGDTNMGLVVVAVAGNAQTLYVGDAPITLDGPGTVAGVTACPWAGGSTRFKPPAFAYSEHGPIVSNLALVGTHVLVFTRPF